MGQVESVSWLRVAIVALMAALALEYVWMQVAPPGARRGRDALGQRIGGAVCTADGQRGDFGKTDYEWQLTAMDGTDTSLLRHKDKVLFINVWATWCKPCIAEMSEIQALHDSLMAHNISFLVISEEDRNTVRSFVQQQGYTFPVYVTERVPQVFESRGIPASFVVDRQGLIVLRKIGAGQWDTDTCRGFLRSLP